MLASNGYCLPSSVASPFSLLHVPSSQTETRLASGEENKRDKPQQGRNQHDIDFVTKSGIKPLHPTSKVLQPDNIARPALIPCRDHTCPASDQLSRLTDNRSFGPTQPCWLNSTCGSVVWQSTCLFGFVPQAFKQCLVAHEALSQNTSGLMEQKPSPRTERQEMKVSSTRDAGPDCRDRWRPAAICRISRLPQLRSRLRRPVGLAFNHCQPKRCRVVLLGRQTGPEQPSSRYLHC